MLLTIALASVQQQTWPQKYA